MATALAWSEKSLCVSSLLLEKKLCGYSITGNGTTNLRDRSRHTTQKLSDCNNKTMNMLTFKVILSRLVKKVLYCFV